jgi:hypothetical protein
VHIDSQPQRSYQTQVGDVAGTAYNAAIASPVTPVRSRTLDFSFGWLVSCDRMIQEIGSWLVLSMHLLFGQASASLAARSSRALAASWHF